MYQCNIDTRDIYHLLRRTSGQRITIPQIVYFDIFDVVAICYIHFAIDRAGAIASIRRGRLGCWSRAVGLGTNQHMQSQ